MGDDLQRYLPFEGVLLVGLFASASLVGCCWLLRKKRKQLVAVKSRLFPQQLFYITAAGLVMHAFALVMVAMDLTGWSHSQSCSIGPLTCCRLADTGFHFGRYSLMLAETHLASGFFLQACGCHWKMQPVMLKLLPMIFVAGLGLSMFPPQRVTAAGTSVVDFCPKEPHFDLVTLCLLVLCTVVGMTSLAMGLFKAASEGICNIKERFSGRWRRASWYMFIFIFTFSPTLIGFFRPRWSAFAMLSDDAFVILDYSLQNLCGALNACLYKIQKRHANMVLLQLCEQEVLAQRGGSMSWPSQAIQERAAARRSFCPGCSFELKEEDESLGESGNSATLPSRFRAESSGPSSERVLGEEAPPDTRGGSPVTLEKPMAEGLRSSLHPRDGKKRSRRAMARFLVDTDGADGVDIVEIADIFDEANQRAEMELALLDFSRDPEIQRDLHASVRKDATMAAASS
mmetsp:Transcript_55284/g.131847  ORF Transcript_55284/g.131847 Transcript_55284/m.131847 type:complete len:457 (+) Transcript_55284:82-1452(+)